jgi:hypothetical protein
MPHKRANVNGSTLVMHYIVMRRCSLLRRATYALYDPN